MLSDHVQNLGQLANDARYDIGGVLLNKSTGRFDSTAPGEIIRIWPNIIFPEGVYRFSFDVLPGGDNVDVSIFGNSVGVASPDSVFEHTLTSTFLVSNRAEFPTVELRLSGPTSIRDVVLELRSPLDRALAGQT